MPSKDKVIEFAFTLLVAGFCLAMLVWWRARDIDLPGPALAGRDGAGNRSEKIQTVKVGSDFEKFSELTEAEKAQKFSDWPRFRNSDFSNLAEFDGGLDFNLENSKVLWKLKLGEGYAAAVVWQNRVYILDYDEKLEADSLRVFSLADGRELWRRYYKIKIRRNHGKSRTVASVQNGKVLTFGPLGHLMCADAISGDLLWTKDLTAEFGAEIPQWYAGQCPLIDGDCAVIGIGGKEVLLAGFDLNTGKMLWKVDNSLKIKMSHSSVMKMEFFGKPQYVYCGIGGIVGISADKADAGTLLWSCDTWRPNVFAPSPVKISDSQIFLTAGYGAGGAILSLEQDSGKFSAKILKSWKAKQGAACEQQTPIVFKNRLLTILPKDAGGNNSLMAVCDIQSDCKIISTSPRDTRFGIGPYMAVNDKILVLDDNGILTVLDMEGDSLKISSRKKVLPGADSWGPMAFSSGLLLLRDSTELVCLDLRKQKK